MKLSLVGALALIFALCFAAPLSASTPIDLNTASAEQIAAALTGVGPAKRKLLLIIALKRGALSVLKS